MRLTIEQAAQSGRPISYEEYLCTPVTRQPYEIIDGVVTMSPAPTTYHQGLIFHLSLLLNAYVTAHRLGFILPAPIDVIIDRLPRVKARQPDILYLSRQRSGLRRLRDLQNMPQLDIAPDLVVEMLSPEEPQRTLAGKLRDYARIGVPEVWPVSSEDQTVEVLRLENGLYVRSGLYGSGDVIVSHVLPGLNLSVDTIFADDDDEDDADAENTAETGENREETGANAAQNSA